MSRIRIMSLTPQKVVMTMSDSWVDEHRPQHYSDIQGNNNAVKKLKQWLRNWSHGDNPQLLTGKPGTGKTSTIGVLANKEGYEIHEVNGSDARSGDDLQALADTIRSNVEGSDRIIVIEEFDSWHHSVKRGSGAKALYAALENPANPVMVTSNDDYDVPNAVTNKCDVHTFKTGVRSRKAKIRKIAEAEDVDITDEEMDRLAERPDLRSAINDLQIFAESEGSPDIDRREWSLSEWDMMDNILNGPEHGSTETGDITPDDVVLWLDENISKEYRGLEMTMAYEALSMADVWLGKAQENREYRFWAYAAAMAETVNLMRQTEPYKPENGIWDSEFPEWFRHSEPKSDGSDEVATLYRELKGLETTKIDGRKRVVHSEGSRFEFAGGFAEFRGEILPLLRSLELEERYQLAFDHRLSDDALTALEIDPSDYDDWVVESAPETGEWGGKMNTAEW